MEAEGQTLMMVPTALVPTIRELIERLENEIDVSEAKKALKEAEAKGTIPPADVKREFGL